MRNVSIVRRGTGTNMQPANAGGLLNIQGMNDTREVAQYRQTDVDQEVDVATAFEEDAKRGKEDGQDNFADVTVLHMSAVVLRTQATVPQCVVWTSSRMRTLHECRSAPEG